VSCVICRETGAIYDLRFTIYDATGDRAPQALGAAFLDRINSPDPIGVVNSVNSV